MNSSNVCSLGDSNLEGKTRGGRSSGRPFIFSEHWKNVGSVDLEQQQERKTSPTTVPLAAAKS